ncbi:methionine--tRNA ligase [Saccharopolyspora sp. NPDC000995]
MTSRRYITTAIPYVNSKPHLGFAMELVEADMMARHWRHRGHEVRFLTGTDDNSLKNAIAAEDAGMPTQEFVDLNAQAFKDLRGPLDISFDDFIRTSGEHRHTAGVERLWRAAAASGDLYQKHYEGLYCVGCEQFYTQSELTEDGLCLEHLTPPQKVSEENWFFKLSHYEDQLRELIESGRLKIEPESRRNEVLSFIKSGLQDFSVSRSVERARGWGIPVPDDLSQVMYVWYDALGNYISALDFGDGEAGPADLYDYWWANSDRRNHVIGKGIIRFHAIYWPAMLMSAGQPVPTHIFVHDYLTVNGRKLGKSLGNAIDPVAIVEDYGTDALRWWLARDVPRVGDADFTLERLIGRYHEDLANGLGNLVNRTVSMIHKYRGGIVPAPRTTDELSPVDGIRDRIDAAMDRFDFRGATGALWEIVDEANRYVVENAPWTLAKAENNGDQDSAARLDVVLRTLVDAERLVADELTPFLPGAAQRVAAQLGDGGDELDKPTPLFPRIELPAEE